MVSIWVISNWLLPVRGGGQTNKQTDTQKHRNTDTQTHRLTDRHKHMHTYFATLLLIE